LNDHNALPSGVRCLEVNADGPILSVVKIAWGLGDVKIVHNLARRMTPELDNLDFKVMIVFRRLITLQEAQLSLTNRALLFCKVVEVLQDFLSECVDKKFTTDHNVP